MKEKKAYSSPPITEAIIEITFGSELQIRDFEKIEKKFNKIYPNRQQLITSTINFGANSSGGSVKVDHQQGGVRLSSNDEADILILSRQKLAAARLAPYQGWEHLYDKIKSGLKFWKSVAKTQAIARVGVRNINRIDIPIDDQGNIENQDYLSIYPKLPKSLDKPMLNYLNQVTLPTTNEFWNAQITSTVIPSPKVNHISLLLDIDVFRTNDIPIKEEDFLKCLSDVRDIKNYLFEECVTPKAKELFN
jgi:uncharacterized protein (TIGR04255 family)